MSIWRRFVGGRQAPVENGAANNQDNALGLMHLRKLFSEFRQPASAGAGQHELEDRLYNMLPLFCKVNN